MGDRYCARRSNQATIRRTREGHECAFNLTCLTRVDCDQFQPERWRSRLDGTELTGSGGNFGIADDGHPGHSWRNFLEQLEPFHAQTVFKTDKARDVATRPR